MPQSVSLCRSVWGAGASTMGPVHPRLALASGMHLDGCMAEPRESKRNAGRHRPTPRVTVLALARAWSPLQRAGRFLLWARAPFARKHYAAEFENFMRFVRGFEVDSQRCLQADESQSVADEAVLLGLLEATRVPRPNALRPNLYDIGLGYRRRKAQPNFREWLAIHEGGTSVAG